MFAVKQLSFGFPGRDILNAVSFDLRPGTITCLLGGNGSGKTTLFNILTGFLRARSGSIRLGETDITDAAPFRVNRCGIARTFPAPAEPKKDVKNGVVACKIAGEEALKQGMEAKSKEFVEKGAEFYAKA